MVEAPSGENRPLKGVEASRRRGSSLRMVFNTHSGRPVGSRRAAKGGEPTARVEGAILFRSPERGDPVSGARARGLLSAAESALTRLTTCRSRAIGGECIKEEVGPVVGQRVPVLRIISWAVRAVFGGEKVYFGRDVQPLTRLVEASSHTPFLQRRQLWWGWMKQKYGGGQGKGSAKISWARCELQGRTARVVAEGPDGAPAGTTHPDGCERAPLVETTPNPALQPILRGHGKVRHPSWLWRRWARANMRGRGQLPSPTAPQHLKMPVTCCHRPAHRHFPRTRPDRLRLQRDAGQVGKKGREKPLCVERARHAGAEILCPAVFSSQVPGRKKTGGREGWGRALKRKQSASAERRDWCSHSENNQSQRARHLHGISPSRKRTRCDRHRRAGGTCTSRSNGAALERRFALLGVCVRFAGWRQRTGPEEGGSAEQIEVAGSSCEACQRRVGFWVSVDEVVVAEGEEIWGSYGETGAYIARWPRPFWRDLAGFVAIGSCSSAADPLVRFLLTTRTNSRAVSLRDWKGFFPYASLSRRSTSGVSTGNSVFNSFQKSCFFIVHYN